MDTTKPRELGRVTTGNAVFTWLESGGWKSDEDPDTAQALTDVGYGRDLNTAMADAFDDVLKAVAARFPGATWELLIPKFNDPNGIN